MEIYRMHQAARPAKDCSGALLAGGRWNPKGIPMLYAAQHLSLACLEVFVHLDRSQVPRDYVWSKAVLAHKPEMLFVKDVDNIDSCQTAGAGWVRARQQLAVQVRSAVIPEEFNVLLNPTHPDYEALVWSEPQPLHFDPGLFTTEPEML